MKSIIEKKRKLILLVTLLVVAFCISVYILPLQSNATEQNNYEELEALELDFSSLKANMNESKVLSSEIYSIGNGYITKILPQTTLQDLKNNLDCQEIQVYNKSNTILKDNELVGTDNTLKIQNEEYKLAVVGDLTGNGKIGITDLVQISLANVGLRNKFSGAYEYAADLNYSGKLTITDVTKTNLAVTNIIDIIAPNSFVPETEVTLSSITVKGETSDSGSGIKEYWYEIDKNGWVTNSDKTNNQYTFSNLQSKKEYTIRMKVVDGAGNTKITKRVKVKTKAIEDANIKISASTEEWTNQNVIVSINYNSNIAEETKQISLDNGQTWSEYTDPIIIEKNMKIKARVINASGKVIEDQEKEITNIDKLSPRDFNITINSTTNSITVAGQTQDSTQTSEYGRSGLKEYEYRIEKGDWVRTYTTTATSYTFLNLEQGEEYKITVTAIDNAGNRKKAKNSSGLEEYNVKVPTIDEKIEEQEAQGKVGKITITPNITNWTNSNVEVTAIYPEITDFTKEISIDNGSTWSTYTAPVVVSKNTTVKARLKDTTRQVGGEQALEIANIDKLAPNDFEIAATPTSNSISVTVSTDDMDATKDYGKSGLQGYSFKINNEDWTAVQSSGVYEFTNLTQGQNYKIRVKALDNVGNETYASKDGSVDGKTIQTPTVEDVVQSLGEIKLKPNTTEYTNKDVIVEAIYPAAIGYTNEISIDNGTTWAEYTGAVAVSKNTTVLARLKDSKGQTGGNKSLKISNIDKLAPKDFSMGTPTSTRYSITVNASTTDATATADNASSGIKEYKYILINGLWKWEATSSNTSYTFNNLTQGKTYQIEVIAIDNAGNEKTALNSGTTSIQTQVVDSAVTITPNTTDWTKNDVTVTVTYPSNIDGLKQEISIDNGATWSDYTNMSTVLTITQNTTVKARIIDPTTNTLVGVEAVRAITNIDKTPPEDFTIINNATTATTIQISANTTDTESGIAGYYFSKDNGATWQNNADLLTTSYTYTGLTPGTAYNMQIKVIDRAGNERIVSKTITTASQFTLTIDPAGGTYTGSTSITQEMGTTITIDNPTRTGYTFNGWTLTGAGTLSGTQYTFGAGNATLTAGWTAIDYTLTYDANGGVVRPTYTTANYGDSISLPTPGKAYTVKYETNGGSAIEQVTVSSIFMGWYTEATDGTKVEYTTMPAKSETLYAHWLDRTGNLPTTFKTGYTFDGWYTDSALTNKAGDAGILYTVEKNQTLYAKWTAIDYTLTLFADGGTGIPSSITANYGDTITLPTPTRESCTVTYNANGGTVSPTTATSVYTFDGWCDTQDQYAPRVTEITMPAKNMNVYAIWNGGYVILPTPTLDGCRFDGWGKTKDSFNNYVGNGGMSYYTVDGNVTLYAIWSCDVQFSVVGSSGLGTNSYFRGEAITLPSMTADGVEISAWYYDEAYNNLAGTAGNPFTPTRAVTLYGKRK